MGTEKTEINFEDLVLINEEGLKEEGNFQMTFEDVLKASEEEEEEIKTEKTEEEGVSLEVKEEKKEEEVKPTNPVEPKVELVPLTDFSIAAKKLLEKGEWKDVIIEDEKGNEIKLSEKEGLTEEEFFEILKAQKDIVNEENKDSFIPVKGIDENKRRIINIIANGGKLNEIFENENDLVRPFEGVDLDNQNTKQNIVYQQFIRQGLTEDEAKELTIKATKDLSLDKKANMIVENYQKQYDENLKVIEKTVLDNKKKEEENIKLYKKDLISFYKEEGIEETLYKPFIDAATKIDETGELHIDTVYDKLMQDPKQAKDLIFFMLEKEKYLKKLGVEVKRDVEIKNMKKIKLVQEVRKPTGEVKEEEERKGSAFDNIVIPE